MLLPIQRYGDQVALYMKSYLAAGLLGPAETGGEENESRSTRLYLPDLTWRAPSLSSNGTPTLDLQGSRCSMLGLLWNRP